MTFEQRHVRNGIGSVRPYIHGPIYLPAFIKHTFDAVELERNEFGPNSMQIEMQIGDSVIVIEAGDLPPEVSPWVSSVYVYVEDVDTVYAQAVRLGAKPLASPEEKPYQERQAGFIDAAGNTWWIATYQP